MKHRYLCLLASYATLSLDIPCDTSFIAMPPTIDISQPRQKTHVSYCYLSECYCLHITTPSPFPQPHHVQPTALTPHPARQPTRPFIQLRPPKNRAEYLHAHQLRLHPRALWPRTLAGCPTKPRPFPLVAMPCAT